MFNVAFSDAIKQPRINLNAVSLHMIQCLHVMSFEMYFRHFEDTNVDCSDKLFVTSIQATCVNILVLLDTVL